MKTDIRRNIVVLGACLLLTIGLGGYVTFVRQPAELERVEKAEQLTRLKQDEVSALLQEAASSEAKANEAVAKWNSRYKIMPASLSSPEIVRYLNDLSADGFKNFDVSLVGINRSSDFSQYSFSVQGRGYYTSLYRFVWDIENNRNFYRIRDLKLDHIDLVTKDQAVDAERLQVMVSFSFTVDAYFGGPDGMSAEVEAAFADAGVHLRRGAGGSSLPPVPSNVLPSRRPAVNPFYPVVLNQLPPNTYGLIDVDESTLIGIADGKAVFSDSKGFRRVGEGDAVYLGRIIEVNPREERVVVRLNRGGIADEVTLELHRGERFKQAQGAATMAPSL